MVERYDTILLAMAAIVATGLLVGHLTSVPMELARALGVLAATPLVYDALFRHPPVPTDPAPRAVAAIAWLALCGWTALQAVGY